MNRRQLLVCGLALGLTGAAPRRTYERAHRAQTRKLVLYFEGSTALLLRATLLTPEFREVLATERKRLVDPTAANHAEYVARMAADAAAFHEVVFAADSAIDNADRFGPADDAWQLRLSADGTDEPVVAVSRVANPTPLHSALYTQVDKWGELWIARFERTVATPRRVVLHTGSGYGHGEVVWDGLRG